MFPDQSLDLALVKLGHHSVRQAPVVMRQEPDRVVDMLLEDISTAGNPSVLSDCRSVVNRPV